MRRPYIRGIPGITETEQIRIIEENGAKADVAYKDTYKGFPKERNKLVLSLRPAARDEVLVSDLAVLAANRKDLRKIRKQLRAKKAWIFEGRTKRRSTHADEFADMIQEAVEFWSNNSRRRMAGKVAHLGGKALAKKRRRERLPAPQASAIWHNKTLTTEEAVDHCNANPSYQGEWSRSTLYRAFGPRGTPSGPRGS